MNKKLLLEDGTEFLGECFGTCEDAFGEVLFITSMTGYQEVLTDPALFGKIVVMSYPLIGNYGINRDDYEALQPHLSGFVVREYAKDPSNFRMNKNLEDYLKKMKVPGLFGIDTRKLTRHIREHGNMKAAILDSEVCKSEGLARIAEHNFDTKAMEATSTKNIYQIPANGKRVVLVDYGTKSSIIRNFSDMGYHVTVVPFDTDAGDILDFNPDAVVLAGGPGNPKDYPEQIKAVQELIRKVPVFGISMGHYLIALACGADIKKLKFGHHSNAPVKDLESGKILMTAQNHDYTVHEGTLAGTDLEVIYLSVNDSTIQGLRHSKQKVFSVQFQPEGTKDGHIAFEQFQRLLAD